MRFDRKYIVSYQSNIVTMLL